MRIQSENKWPPSSSLRASHPQTSCIQCFQYHSIKPFPVCDTESVWYWKWSMVGLVWGLGLIKTGAQQVYKVVGEICARAILSMRSRDTSNYVRTVSRTVPCQWAVQCCVSEQRMPWCLTSLNPRRAQVIISACVLYGAPFVAKTPTYKKDVL